MSSFPPPPGQPPYGSIGVDRARAVSQVQPPAIALMVVGGLGVLGSLLGLLARLLGVGLGTFASHAPDERLVGLFAGGVGILAGLVGLVIYGVVLFGAIKMNALQSYGLAMAAAIMAMLPCGCCCLIGLPVGIWALVVLLDANVKAAFR